MVLARKGPGGSFVRVAKDGLSIRVSGMNGRNGVLVSLVFGMLSVGCDQEKPGPSRSESAKTAAIPNAQPDLEGGRKAGVETTSAGLLMDATLGREVQPSALRAAAASLLGKWTAHSLRKEDWPQEFRELEPKGIYQHNANTVIALRKDETTEEGIYIVVPWSSNRPVNGEEWEFRIIGEDVWRYSRREFRR